MATAIHIEINALFLIILCVIAWQITTSVSKQTSRVLFRYVVYGNMAILSADIIWMFLDGKIFPGSIFLSKIVNAFLLGMAVAMGILWYQYVLESLGYNISQRTLHLIMIPCIIAAVLNILSIWTGWTFTITPENRYVRGPWFSIQTIISLATLFGSLIHLLFELFNPQKRVPREVILKLLSFYIVPVIGTLWALPYPDMPGTWTCAAASIILMYMNDQDNAILRDSLTGLNNRKPLDSTFAAYSKQIDTTKNLYLFLFDLDNFKTINDTLGHPVGDQALVNTARILKGSVKGRQGLLSRFGGDEFVLLGFFKDDAEAADFSDKVRENFAEWNKTHNEPYVLSTSIGYAPYQNGQSLNDLLGIADEKLYIEKRARKVGR
ncbi:MAG: diguanylate cyclase [Flexilinea sp.]|nr:diguanylate cyclase [Flexilinea sp.]